MPKLDPADLPTSTTTAASAAPIASTTTSGFGSTSTAPSTGFGASSASSFGASASSGFGSAPAGGGFGGSSSAGGFGSGSSMGGGFGGGSSMGGGFGGGMSGGMGNGMSGGMGMGGGMGGMAPQNSAMGLQSTGGAMQEGGTAAIEVSGGFSDFINQRWRPLMAVIYMITCMTDFVIFPVLWSMMQAYFHGTVTSQWQPLTLQGAGLYHIAMGAVLGLAAYGRSQEKIAGKS